MNRFCYNEKWLQGGKDFGSQSIDFFCIYCLISSASTKQLLSLWFVKEAKTQEGELSWRTQNGQGKEVWNRVASWEKFPVGHHYLELTFHLGEEGIISNFLAILSQKKLPAFWTQASYRGFPQFPHRPRYPPNKYRGGGRMRFYSLPKRVAFNGCGC